MPLSNSQISERINEVINSFTGGMRFTPDDETASLRQQAKLVIAECEKNPPIFFQALHEKLRNPSSAELKDYDFYPAYCLLYEAVRGNFSSLVRAIIENLEYFIIQKEYEINGYGVFIKAPQVNNKSETSKMLTSLIRNREVDRKKIRIDPPKKLTILINSCQIIDELHGRSLLCLAAQSNEQGDIIKLLVDKGADVNYVDYNYNTALSAAFEKGNILAANILISDPKIILIDQVANLFTSFPFSNEKALIFKKLIDLVEDIDQKNENGLTLLQLAIQKCSHSEIIKLLLAGGADPNILDSQGNTPLHLIVTSNYISGKDMDSVKYLLINGADINIKNHDNLNVIELAKKFGDFRYSYSRSGIFEEIATDQPNDNHNRPEYIKVRGYAHYIPIWQEEVRALRKKSQPTQMQVEEVLSGEGHKPDPVPSSNSRNKRKTDIVLGNNPKNQRTFSEREI